MTLDRQTSRGTASIRQVCQVFGLSRQALAKARKPCQPRRARPPPSPPAYASHDELVAGIQTVVAEQPGWGTRKVWASLRKRRGLVVSRRRVWAVMRSLGLVLEPSGQPRDLPGGHVYVEGSNRRWASDLTTVWTRQDGVVAITPVVDCGDRFLLACGVDIPQDAPTVLLPVESALHSEFTSPAGVPWAFELLTDHGPQYTGSDCKDLCTTWKVDHLFSRVGRPTGNALAERLIKTLKVELIWTRDWDSLDELRTAVEAWMHTYNRERPHQALGWLTPAEKRANSLGCDKVAA